MARKDTGCLHAASRFTEGLLIRRYSLDGTFEREFRSMGEAIRGSVEDGIDGVTYNGIYRAVTGLLKTHAKRLWRSETGEGTGLLKNDAERVSDAACEWLRGMYSRGYNLIEIMVVNSETGEMERRSFNGETCSDRNIM